MLGEFYSKKAKDWHLTRYLRDEDLKDIDPDLISALQTLVDTVQELMRRPSQGGSETVGQESYGGGLVARVYNPQVQRAFCIRIGNVICHGSRLKGSDIQIGGFQLDRNGVPTSRLIDLYLPADRQDIAPEMLNEFTPIGARGIRTLIADLGHVQEITEAEYHELGNAGPVRQTNATNLCTRA